MESSSVRQTAAPDHGIAWWGGAFCGSLLIVFFLTRGVWWPALVIGVVSVLALLVATKGCKRPTFFIPPARLAFLADGNGLLRPGLLACTAALFLAVWAGWYLYAVPFIDWILLAYPLTLLVGWCGEGWLRGQTVRVRLAAIGRGIRARRGEIALIALITAVDLALHLWLAYQDAFLHGSVHDEATVGLDAWRLTRRVGLWPLYETMGGAVSMYQPLGWLFMHFTSSMLLLRLYAIPMAVAIAPAFYLLARQVVAAPAALCAAALLALAYWPTMMGSMAFGWMNGTVFQCLGLALLLYGMRRWSACAMAAAGMTLALCMYSYSSSRLMPIPAMILVLIFLIRARSSWRHRCLMSGVFVMAFLVVIAPWIKLVTTYDFLLKGDAPYMTQYFTNSWSEHPLTATGEALQNAATLNLALIARPLGAGYPYMVLPSGGLLDPVTAALILVGLAGAVLCMRHPVHVVVLTAVLLPIPVAAMAMYELSEVYRLSSMVPALFLSAALSLNQVMALARTHWRAVRAFLLVLALWGGAMNIRQITSFVTEDRTMCDLTDVYSSVRAAYIALADQTRVLEPSHAVFLVINNAHAQPWNLYVPVWTWLFHQPLPVQAFAVAGQSPGRWRTQANPETAGTPSDGARFWPPQVGSREVGITYFMVDDARDIFMPTLRADYPGGALRVIHPPQCAATGFVLTSYALTAARLHRDTVR